MHCILRGDEIADCELTRRYCVIGARYSLRCAPEYEQATAECLGNYGRLGGGGDALARAGFHDSCGRRSRRYRFGIRGCDPKTWRSRTGPGRSGFGRTRVDRNDRMRCGAARHQAGTWRNSIPRRRAALCQAHPIRLRHGMGWGVGGALRECASPSKTVRGGGTRSVLAHADRSYASTGMKTRNTKQIHQQCCRSKETLGNKRHRFARESSRISTWPSTITPLIIVPFAQLVSRGCNSLAWFLEAFTFGNR